MRRRDGRRGGNWAPLVFMGLAALVNLIRRSNDTRGGSPFDLRPPVMSPFRPLFNLGMLVAAFVTLGVLLTVLSLIAALGNGGALLAVCGLPVLVVAAAAWFINQRNGRTTSNESDSQPGTIDAMPGEVREADSQNASPQRTGSASSAPANRLAPVISRAEPARRTTKGSAIPERPPVTPAQYRQRAVGYRRKIQSLIKTRRPGPIAERMSGVLEKLKSWEERVGQLADRLTLFETDDLIQRDVRETPGHIARLQRQLNQESEPEMQQQVRRTLAAYEEQYRQLELLARVMKRTRLNLDDTLAAMGTVYSQLQVLNAIDIDGPTAARIAGDVDREVERLNDLLSAVADVYSQGGESSELRPEAPDDENAGLAGRKSRLSGNSISQGTE